MSSDAEMEENNVPTSIPFTSANAPRPRKSKRDYSLSPAFFALITRPIDEVIAELLPLPVDHIVPVSNPKASREGDAFVGAFRKHADSKTEKGGNAHHITLSAVVDLFFDMTPPVNPGHIQELLAKAYDEDPLATTRLIFQTRSIHEGKGYKEGFWVAAGWLWTNHPRTLLANLHILVDPTCPRDHFEHGRTSKILEEDVSVTEGNLKALSESWSRPHGTFDDLIDLLILHISGQLNGEINQTPDAVDEGIAPAHHRHMAKKDRQLRKATSGAQRGRRVFNAISAAARQKSPESFRAQLARCGTRDAKHRLFSQRLETSSTTDIKFQALYCSVVNIFVTQLKIDLALLDKHRDFLNKPEDERRPFLGETSPYIYGISYAAKWVPSPGKSADKQLRIASAIAMRFFPGEGAELAREQLQRDVLSPLRAIMKIPESRMGSGNWSMDYGKVPSRAMARHAVNFAEHDPKGFDAYLTKVAKAERGISGAALFPHEILIDAIASEGRNPIIAKVANLQWKSFVTSLRESTDTPLQNCLAIADVSNSMGAYLPANKAHPQPITVCLALTLLLGELAAAPWNGLPFSFSSDPKAVYIEPSLPLATRALMLQQSPRTPSANIYKVFDLILSTALAHKLQPDAIVKKLFIFSNMQFDQCVERCENETEYLAIKRKFVDAGYMLPELIFWNLASGAQGAPKPVRANQEAVSLLSGYSGAMMKYFLGEAESAEVEREKRADAIGEDWELVSALHDEGEDTEVVGEGVGTAVQCAVRRKATREARRRKDDPLDTVARILGAESFKGVVVVD